jgi:AmmeMemoRadiSam system protein A
VLGAEDRRLLGRLAWASLVGVFDDEARRVLDAPVGVLAEPHGVFVTLRSRDELRGCIGSALPRRPLAAAVAEHARGAATRDPRFPPVLAAEIPTLDVEISVLGPMRRLLGSGDEIAAAVRPGADGLYLVCGERSGLLLPQVAARYAWDAVEFLEQTAVKAGLEAGEWRSLEARVHVFRAVSFEAPRPLELPLAPRRESEA